MPTTCKETGCGKPTVGREMCNTHYHAWRRRAKREGTFVSQKPTDLTERFWKFVDKSGKHWLWTGPVNRKGYGRLIIESENRTVTKRILAHRFSYELHIGPIPEGLNVLHRCDIPPCVHPNDLFLGTIQDNALDMSLKHRGHRPRLFDRQQAQEIRDAYAQGTRVADLAFRHGASPDLIYKVLQRRQPYND